jgi:hypothetical protein
VELRKAWRGKEWTAEFGGYHSVTAASKTEARELAYKTMEEMVAADYRMRVLTYRNLVAMIWRQPAGWHYSIVKADEAENGVLKPGGGCSADWRTIDDVERDVRRHMAQWATASGDDGTFSDHSAFILNDEDRGEYLRWLGWQRAVRAALDAGHDMEKAREIAGRARYAA